MQTALYRALWAMALSSAILACGRPRPDGPQRQDDSANGPLHVVLKAASLASQRAFPGDELDLRVLAMRSAGSAIAHSEDLVPAAGEVITWALLGPGSQAVTLSAENSLTTASGVGVTTLAISSESPSNVTFQVQSTLAGADPVFFTVQIRRDTRKLVLLSGTPTAGGALVNTVKERSERLRMRLVRDMNGGADLPVGGEPLHVELLGGSRDGAQLDGAPGATITVTTDLSGIATLKFLTGDRAPAVYDIEICARQTCPGVPPQKFSLSVASRGALNTECVYYTDCDTGFVCDAGACKIADTYCDTHGNCPTGYRCGPQRVCVLDDGGATCTQNSGCAEGEQCGSGARCIDDGGCTSEADCDETWQCDVNSGACTPPSAIDALDVRGQWLTQYHFDISDTLPGFFTGGLGPVVDFLDLVFRDQLDIDVPIIGDILEGVIQGLVGEYVPPWVPTVTLVLGDFVHLFENVETEGDMLLLQHPTSPVLGPDVSGEEQWTKALFFVASFCPGGNQQFNDDPSCGQVDLVMTPVVQVDYSNNDPTVGVRVRSFTGRVQGTELTLFERRVELGLRQMVNVILDIIVTAASNGQWYDFEEFLVDIVPCDDLQYAVDDLACDLSGGDICTIPGVSAICFAAANAATAALTEALGGIGIGMEITFDARARIHDSPADGRADVLGAPSSPAQTGESALVGSTDTGLFGGDLDPDSWWFGRR